MEALKVQFQQSTGAKPWIAVFDLKVTKNSPAGSCVLAEVLGLADEFDITVFSDAFDNDNTGRVRWVRVPLPGKPGILRYVFFNLLAPRALRKHIAQRGTPPVLIQATQGQFIGADICYAHFCHRSYLEHQWQFQKARGLRRLVRWITHQYNATTERLSFLKAAQVVTPSQGLVRELTQTYSFLKARVIAIPNPVDVESFARPEGFDRNPLLARLGLPVYSRVLCFAALGDFSRKGLGVLLEALSGISDLSVRLLVVGGNAGEIAEFNEIARKLNVSQRVAFAGYQSDVRQYLWASDLFVLPSLYETFALVVMQAMAAGVPAIVTRLHGVEDYAVQGENAWFVERNPDAVRAAIVTVLSDEKLLQSARITASQTVARYDKAPFVEAWRKCMREAIAAKLNDGMSDSVKTPVQLQTQMQNKI
ncbi:glycosyltransferase family 4 protein [Sideroxydans sp. CL21]|uniref:glycosyltransferase family 4 protein n=1 Tax=Sideroxydans sp. CL21 TaxID=2600596 RepID=UPI0024BD19EB|nr:glycosyltransferase family 4 protein [Sideroxydans sp. CL21]